MISKWEIQMLRHRSNTLKNHQEALLEVLHKVGRMKSCRHVDCGSDSQQHGNDVAARRSHFNKTWTWALQSFSLDAPISFMMLIWGKSYLRDRSWHFIIAAAFCSAFHRARAWGVTVSFCAVHLSIWSCRILNLSIAVFVNNLLLIEMLHHERHWRE